jgi:hypothetical protein
VIEMNYGRAGARVDAHARARHGVTLVLETMAHR